ncbi:hypothetical protein DID88_004176 [Monilinia fructigena]|uniref:Peroxidase n=1 Tax=Monilinia fructigena TaxID=38457 RepID=A0A395IS28_9HELO|nr:hypothetical protein DID88_004176 [Monilinia fructigena]
MASTTRTFARAGAAFKSTAFRPATRTTAFNVSRQAFRQQSHRGYASEGPAKSSFPLSYGVAALALAGGAGYYFVSQGNGSLLSGSSNETSGLFTPKFEDYQKIYNEIAERLEEKDDYDDGSYGPVLLRLAWHCSGTYDKETGTGARDFLAPIKAKHPWISYSDLWILAGICAIQEMQGPIIPFRPGRQDKEASACTPDGRLPDASQGNKHLRAIFGRMGFNDQEIVALSGAHALGRCHTDRSGFNGPWTFSPTVLTNDYYKLLLDEKWNWKKWNGPKQYEDKTTKSLMMLPTDMALVSDKSFRSWVEKYAKDEALFMKDFGAVVNRLFELGVPFAETTEQAPMKFKPTNA